MRSNLLAGGAVATLRLVGPSISTRRGQAALDPRSVGREICRARTGDGQRARRGHFLAAALAYAQATAAGRQDGSPPPIFEGVASTVLEATVNDAARPYFRQGVGLADGFNHMEAVRAFRAARALDPDCALCFWGEAYVLGPNIDDAMIRRTIPARSRRCASRKTRPSARPRSSKALLRGGQAERAEQEFFATLVESPDNGWADWGPAKAREAQGDAAGAEAAMTMWRDAWAGEEEPSLDRL